MKKHAIVCAAAALLSACGLARADDAHNPSPEEMAAMMAKWQKVAAPSEHHKHLDAFVGKWNTTMRMWMEGPGSAPMEAPGVSEIKWGFGGRFIVEDHNGQMMGQPYIGMGLTGYDNYQNMYIGIWANNQATSLINMKGIRDPSGKRWTFFGEMDEPMLDVYGRTVKYVIDMIDADTHTFAVYDLHAGDEYKVVEVAYKRAK